MVEGRTEWTDPRISDLHITIRQNTENMRILQNLVAAHDLQLIEIARERASRLDQRFSFRVALFTVVSAQVLSTLSVIVVMLVTRR